MLRNTQSTPPAGSQQDQFSINVRALQTKDFHTQLVELAITTFLRALITEHRTDVPQTLFLIVQQTMFNAGTHAASSPFSTQRQAFTVAVFEGIHLFFHDISHFTNGAFK